jgi:hypothetical protein
MWKVGILAGALSIVSCARNIKDYGAVSGLNDTETAFTNQKAFYNAMLDANASDTDREILIAAGDVYTMMPSPVFSNLSDITITIEGTVLFSEDNEQWPLGDDGKVLDFLHIQDSQGIHIRGSGMIDG